MNRFVPTLLASATLLAVLSASAQAASYNCVKVSAIGDVLYPDPEAINNKGQISGMNDFGGSRNGVAAVWKKGTVLDLGAKLPPEATFSSAKGLNDKGQSVGWVRVHDCGQWCSHELPVLWQGDTPTQLPMLDGASDGQAWAINDHGRAIGYNRLPSGAEHAVLWRDGKVKDLGTLSTDQAESSSHAYGIGPNNVVVGSSERTGQFFYEFATTWNAKGQITDLGGLPQAMWSDAWGINTGGVAVGRSHNPPHDRTYSTPVAWVNGAAIDLGMLDANARGIARGINDSNTIVGWQEYNATYTALHWSSPSAAPQRLDDLVGAKGCQADGLKFRLTRAYAINQSGQIAAQGQTAEGKVAVFRLTPR